MYHIFLYPKTLIYHIFMYFLLVVFVRPLVKIRAVTPTLLVLTGLKICKGVV